MNHKLLLETIRTGFSLLGKNGIPEMLATITPERFMWEECLDPENFKIVLTAFLDPSKNNDYIDFLNDMKEKSKNIIDYSRMRSIVNTIDEELAATMGDISKFTKEEIEALRNFLEVMEGYTMEDHYGGEGQGASYYAIYFLPAVNAYIQFDGWYQSHHGSEFTSMFLVNPTKVETIEWKREN